jgi:hypothetical protein
MLHKKQSTKRVRLKSASGYQVGYGKPPIRNRYKPGQSGNYNGRPKGQKSEESILRQLLSRKVSIREGGRLRKISLLEAVWHRIVQDALGGNLKAAAFVLNRYAALKTVSTDAGNIDENGSAILAAYAENIISKFGRGEGFVS